MHSPSLVRTVCYPHSLYLHVFAFFSHLSALQLGRYTLCFPSGLCDLSTPFSFIPGASYLPCLPCRLDGCRHKPQQWMRFLRIFFAPLCTAAWTLYLVFPVRIVRFEYSLFLLTLARPIYIACRVVWMVVDKSHNSECDSLLGTWAVVLIYYPLYIEYTVVIIVVCMLFYPEFISSVLIEAYE